MVLYIILFFYGRHYVIVRLLKMYREDVTQWLMYDIKRDYFEEKNNICRVMRYYTLKKMKDLENPKFPRTTEELYCYFEWNKYYYFDCLCFCGLFFLMVLFIYINMKSTILLKRVI